MKRNMLMLAAAFLSPAALAAPGLDLSPNSEIFQYGDSLYTLDQESGGAVRVGAIWDGFTPEKQSNNLFVLGDYIYQRDVQTGMTVEVSAVWDGAVASVRTGETVALKR